MRSLAVAGNNMEEPICNIDPYKYLHIVRDPDGSITRHYEFPTTTTASEPYPFTPVLTKDVPINPQHGTYVRMYRPSVPSPAASKLPLVVYFHGGGFILVSAASSLSHDFCSQMAIALPAVVISVDYRLAPEHRLPAAYDDAMEALHWIKRQEEPWVRDFGDVSSCFLMGSSAGGNIVYHAGLRAAGGVDLEPLRIRGLVLHQPFFGGTRRTASEIRLIEDPILPLSVTDMMWDLSLPVDADRDHEYCNPAEAAGGPFDRFGKIKDLGWRILVTASGEDPLVDRQVAVMEMLEREGVAVERFSAEGDCHGVELWNPVKAKALFDRIKKLFG